MVAAYGDSADGDPAIARVRFDGKELERIHIRSANHDFAELADGTIAAIVSDARRAGGVRYRGNALVERSPEGTERTVWSAFDEPDPLPTPSRYDDGKRWTHANRLDDAAASDSYLPGVGNLAMPVKIGRSSGGVVEQIGGEAPSLPLAGPSAPFSGQHQVQWLEDGLPVLDNSADDRVSRPVDYAFDADRTTLTETMAARVPTPSSGTMRWATWSATAKAAPASRIRPPG